MAASDHPGVPENPFFTVGVTTFNRPDYLKQTLESILRQTFGNFEVIVGNDYTQETICPESLGITDERIRIVNHPRNLGEMGNMNALLRMAKGRYFTWLADDDLYAPDFFKSVQEALTAYAFPSCVFTTFLMEPSSNMNIVSESQTHLLTGVQFLKGYLTRNIKVQGCYGVFEIDYLKSIGGMEQLGSGFSPYSDNLLAIRTGLLGRIVFINAPLILFRIHGGSLSLVSKDVNAYFSAQRDLLEKSLPVLKNEVLQNDFNMNLSFLMKWCTDDIVAVTRRNGSISHDQYAKYIHFLKQNIPLLSCPFCAGRAWLLMFKTLIRLLPYRDRAMVRRSQAQAQR